MEFLIKTDKPGNLKSNSTQEQPPHWSVLPITEDILSAGFHGLWFTGAFCFDSCICLPCRYKCIQGSAEVTASFEAEIKLASRLYLQFCGKAKILASSWASSSEFPRHLCLHASTLSLSVPLHSSRLVPSSCGSRPATWLFAVISFQIRSSSCFVSKLTSLKV